MPVIRANRDSIDDRFAVLGFSVRTESPLFEVGLATDPELFKPENRPRRTRRNFYSSRTQGAMRARRGEAVYLVPPDVMTRFVGAQRVYFGLATYPESPRSKPDFVQAPTAGSMYVNVSGLTERGLRRLVPGRLAPSSYGKPDGAEAGLDWGGDLLATGGAMPGSAAPVAPAPASGGANSTATPAPATAQAYSDGYSDDLWQQPAPLSGAQELLTRPYEGGLWNQLQFFAESINWFAGVTDTRDFPHSAICAIGPFGDLWATGFYIGPNRILTAAHVLSGARSITVVPGKNGAGTSPAEEPFGRRTIASSSWRIAPGYTGSGNFVNDLAVIDNFPIPAPGGKWFEFLQQTPSDRMPIVVCGYSGQSRTVPQLTGVINGSKQHLHGSFARQMTDPDLIDYSIQTLAGASGSPVYHLDDSSGEVRALICAVHVTTVGSGDLNRGCFITPAKIDWIEGRTTAFAYDEAPAARVASRAQGIPLDPGAGGQSIGLAALQAGDLIVSTVRAAVSYAIRGGTFSSVSHAMLYIGDGEVVEAVGSGVRRTTLANAIDDAILAVAYRDPRVDADKAQLICEYAKAQVGKPYSYAGVAATGLRIINPVAAVAGWIHDRLSVDPDTAGSYYCSELLFAAYAHAGIPLTGDRASNSVPNDIVRLSHGRLNYVGHLKARDEFLGVALGIDAPMAATPPARATVRPLSAEAPEVEVKLRVFIPAPALPAPGITGARGFHGDGRSFSYSGGTSRAEIKARVRLAASGVAPAITVLDRRWGETTEYEPSALLDVPGRADWYKQLASGAMPIARATLALTDDNLKIVLGGAGSTTNNILSVTEGTTLVTLIVSGGNPLVGYAPNIDATLHLHLKNDGGRLKAWVKGSHDGFPAYELYVAGKRVYEYDPEPVGESPYALSPPEDRSVDTGYVEIGAASAVAQGLATGSQALSGQSWSVHWDTVPYISQQTDSSCWAAAAAMVVGWRDGTVPSDADIAAKVPALDAYRKGLWPRDRRQLRDVWHLVPEPPASYTIDGWRNLLETYGPLWLDMTNSAATGGHAWVLVGMTSDGAEDGSDTMMYLHNPTASRGKVKWPFPDFLRFYEGRVGTEGEVLENQILHAASVPAGRRPVTVSPFALVMSADGKARPATDIKVTLPPPPAPVVGVALSASASARPLAAPVVIPIVAAFVGAVSTRLLNDDGDVSWELDQLNGLKHPNNVAPNPLPPAMDGPVIRLTDWPKWELNIGDEISAGFEINWQYNGQSVGNVSISNVATNDAVAWGLTVKAHIIDDAIVYPRDNPTFAALKIRFEYRFSSPIHDDAIAIQDVHLFGNGRYNVTGRWEQH